jgi:hypothetical protein
VASFFFYGTLLDPDVRRLVLGRTLEPASLHAATLADHRISRARGKTYPILAAKRGVRAHGLVASHLDDRDAARLFHYEDAGYDIVEIDLAVHDGHARAWVLMPGPRMKALPVNWSYASWRRTVKARVMPGIAAWMAAYPGPGALPLYRRWRLRRHAA